MANVNWRVGVSRGEGLVATGVLEPVDAAPRGVLESRAAAAARVLPAAA